MPSSVKLTHFFLSII